jgi:hypothetical protein
VLPVFRKLPIQIVARLLSGLALIILNQYVRALSKLRALKHSFIQLPKEPQQPSTARKQRKRPKDKRLRVKDLLNMEFVLNLDNLIKNSSRSSSRRPSIHVQADLDSLAENQVLPEPDLEFIADIK